MKTVKEVSALTGVSIRTLHYYDSIGLLRPAGVTESGYRLYDRKALERLQMILLFRELEFPLSQIKEILDSPGFDREKAVKQQIDLLTMKKERIEKLLKLARDMNKIGVNAVLDFNAFDKTKLEEYAKEAKDSWGNTKAFQEFEKKGHTEKEQSLLNAGLMEVFRKFGGIRESEPGEERVQELVKELQDYITEYFYTCTPEILSGLGAMYAGDKRFQENIDRAGGKGTAAFVKEAICLYCQKESC